MRQEKRREQNRERACRETKVKSGEGWQRTRRQERCVLGLKGLANDALLGSPHFPTQGPASWACAIIHWSCPKWVHRRLPTSAGVTSGLEIHKLTPRHKRTLTNGNSILLSGQKKSLSGYRGAHREEIKLFFQEGDEESWSAHEQQALSESVQHGVSPTRRHTEVRGQLPRRAGPSSYFRVLCLVELCDSRGVWGAWEELAEKSQRQSKGWRKGPEGRESGSWKKSTWRREGGGDHFPMVLRSLRSFSWVSGRPVPHFHHRGTEARGPNVQHFLTSVKSKGFPDLRRVNNETCSWPWMGLRTTLP